MASIRRSELIVLKGEPLFQNTTFNKYLQDIFSPK